MLRFYIKATTKDVVAVDGNGYAATGSMQFETFIKNLTED